MMALYLLIAYLLGSIPFGLITAKYLKVDIRRHGSGNIGATNVFRTLGPVPGAIAFALDFFKGVIPVCFGYWLGVGPTLTVLLGTAAILGHMYPIYLGFKGGKGAATGLGVLAGLAPEIFVIALILGALVIYATRYVSLASIITPFVVVILMASFHKPLAYTLFTLVIAIFIVIRHLPNIKRLRAGTEAKI